MIEKYQEIATRARRQHGHVTRAQISAAGVHRSSVPRWVRTGRLVQVGHQTFRLASAPRTRRGDVFAACLDLGATASHWTAAWLHGRLPPRDLIDVTVRKGKAMHAPGVGHLEQARIRVHTTTNLPTDDIVLIDAIPTTSEARTMLGLAALVPAELSERRLFEVVGRAIDGDGPATDAWFWWLLTERRCRGRNGVITLEEVLAARARLGPTESWLEREALRVLGAAGLALPETQRIVHRNGRFAARVDFLYEPAIVLEVMGYAFHRTEAQMSADVARANDLQLLGFEVYQFTARQIVSAPEAFVATVQEALARRRQAAA